MNRLLSLASIFFLSGFLLSCEQAEIEPSVPTASLTLDRASGCGVYSYFNKIVGDQYFGPARGEVVLVRFAEGMSLAARQQLLDRYPQVQGIDGEVELYSGILTRVRMLADASCAEIERLLLKLQREGTVVGAYPFFKSMTTDPGEPWVGLSNEFMVSLEEGTTREQLEKVVAQSKTRILFSFSDEIHVITTDKNSTGSVLQICTIFNQQPFVTVAEPNLVYYFPNDGSGAAATSIQPVNFSASGAFHTLK